MNNANFQSDLKAKMEEIVLDKSNKVNLGGFQILVPSPAFDAIEAIIRKVKGQ